MASGIYQIRNPLNDKVYIGSSIDMVRREKRHFDELLRKCHVNPKLQAAYNKYGIENFVFELVEECPIPDLLIREQHYLDQLDFESNYNIALVAGSPMRGRKHSDETRSKLRAARAKNPSSNMKGKKQTDDAKRRMSINTSGEKNPMFGVPSPMTGRNHSDDVKQKLSEMRSGSGNTMFGKSGSLSPTSKKVIVDGIQYDSITLAGMAIGVSRKVVEYRIKSDKYPGYIKCTT